MTLRPTRRLFAGFIFAAVWCVIAAKPSFFLAFGEDAPRDSKSNAAVIIKFDKNDMGRQPPEGWHEMIFDAPKKKSVYEVVKDENEGYVLRAKTDGGVSGLYKTVTLNARDYPYIIWHWRVCQVFGKADECTKKGDDYPARVYIGFKYDPSRVDWTARLIFEAAKGQSLDGRYPPLYMLGYVWANRLKQNTWIPNPWQDRSKMIAVRSGPEGLGKWRTEVRNYYEDFKAVVGAEPPPVEFIAVMIDGDGTGASGVSYFGAIRFTRRLPPALAGRELATPQRGGRTRHGSLDMAPRPIGAAEIAGILRKKVSRRTLRVVREVQCVAKEFKVQMRIDKNPSAGPLRHISLEMRNKVSKNKKEKIRCSTGLSRHRSMGFTGGPIG